MTLVAGIDTGLGGAIALVDHTRPSEVVNIFDMPTWWMLVGKTKKRRIDVVALADHFDHLERLGVELFVIETVGGRPKQSASAAFTFGYGVGLVYAFAIRARIPVETIPAATWKRLMRVPIDDSGIIARAEEFFPNDRMKFRGAKGGLRHDRAEACMLAKFGADHLLQATDRGIEWRMIYRKNNTGA